MTKKYVASELILKELRILVLVGINTIMMIHSYSTTQLTLKTICVRMERVGIILYNDT